MESHGTNRLDLVERRLAGLLVDLDRLAGARQAGKALGPARRIATCWFPIWFSCLLVEDDAIRRPEFSSTIGR